MSLPQNQSPILRELNTSDAAAMASLHALSFAEPQQWTADSIRGLMLQPTTQSFALGHNDAILGFMMASFVANEAEILTLAMHPEQRRKGYAKRLIKHFIQLHRIQKLQKIFLEVAANNSAAINLYRSLGFTIIATRANYYTQQIGIKPLKVDGLVMSKTF